MSKLTLHFERLKNRQIVCVQNQNVPVYLQLSGGS